ncbi:MAG: pyocin activator PrtN family protein [Pseudomonadota bacterium]
MNYPLKIDTRLALMSIHLSTDIPLDKVARDYLDLEPEDAARLARQDLLPFPAWRANHFSPWLVRVDELAHFIDQRHTAAATQWQKQQEQLTE